MAPPKFRPRPAILGNIWIHIPVPADNSIVQVSAKQVIGSDEVPFLKRLKAALTDWIRNTDSGREAWAWSFQNFTVGDIAFWDDRPELLAALSQQGIYDLMVEFLTVETPPDWQHDTIIVDTNQLEGGQPLKLTNLRR